MLKQFFASVLTTFMVGCGLSPSYVSNHTKASIVRITGIVSQESMFGKHEVNTVCTGFVVAPGRVLTAEHCSGTNMLLDGLAGNLVKADAYFDLALFTVDKLDKPSLTLRDLPTHEGEKVVAVGYGFGWGTPFVLHLTVVIPNHHTTSDNASGVISQGEYIHGMSGGPQVDSLGRVVAIVQQTHEGESYGVGVKMIRAFLLDAGLEVD